ncbi:MAG: hypothetical protein AAFP68_19395, partial [Pseudomonadota bacterium]
MGNVTDASVEVGDLQDKSFDVCVVGSGPVGAAVCHSLTQSGRKVLCIEAGSTSADAKRTALSAADLSNASNHKPVESVVSRSLGGTARLWGGRCVPFDAIDLDRLTDACVCQIFVGDLADLVCRYVGDTFRPIRRVL